MKQFEKVTQSVEVLAEFLSTENKGKNLGCAGCESYEVCEGKATCKKLWADFLNSEVEPPASDKAVNVKETLEKQLELLKERSGQCEDRDLGSLTFAMLELCKSLTALS